MSPGIASSLSEIASTDSATIVLSTIWFIAQFCEEPGARNSNLLPVKANGEVRLRSVVSRGRGGSVSTPIFHAFRPFGTSKAISKSLVIGSSFSA